MSPGGPPLAWSRPLQAGVPLSAGGELIGTLGGFATDTLTGQRILLGCQHVLGLTSHAKVWQPAPCGEPGCECNVIGKVLRSCRSLVRWRDRWHFIDAAVVAIDDDVEVQGEAQVGISEAAVGMHVYKHGAATGTTRGVIVTERFADSVPLGRHAVQAPNQLLIRCATGDRGFSTVGDSGSLVRDQDGRAVGLLWGAKADGDGVACPIGPVLEEMQISM